MSEINEDDIFTQDSDPIPTTENYNDDSIVHLEDMEHIRRRPGMYIGKLGDGASQDDGIYVLIKEVIDNSIDEFTSGFGKKIEVRVDKAEKKVSIRDYESVREGKTRIVEFAQGKLINDSGIIPSDGDTGTLTEFIPDSALFGNFHYVDEYIEKRVWNYAYLNRGLSLIYNDKRYYSKNGLLDLLQNNMEGEGLYPIIHIKDGDFEAAFTHVNGQSSDYFYSFVNGQHTTEGGTHQSAFREGYARVVREFYQKEYEPADIRQGLICALCVRIQEPVFEAQTKTKLGSTHLAPNNPDGTNDSPFLKTYVFDILKRHLDNYLHKNPETVSVLQAKIQANEKERKEIAGIKKAARESAKKVSLNNRKLRDCRIHLNTNHEKRLESTIFITEGDSASGSITKSRDVQTQAVFSLRGKPLNCLGMTKKVCYENEEFNLLQAALNIDEDIENLRYNNIVIATDADVDGMHIRLLMLTFFLQFYPDLVRNGHVYILQTPLFRVRNKKETYYCYSDEERLAAKEKCGKQAEITRFKGLGEISPDEFRGFIGPNMRLEPVILRYDFGIKELLEYYMGKNTMERQKFIIDNLRIEDDSEMDKM